jgi:tetratricopeptide (TPR) repeat protein
MATTSKKKPAPDVQSTGPNRPAPEKPRNVAAYDAAVADFAASLELFSRGQFAAALPRLQAIAASCAADEPILSDRARTYASIAARRSAAAPTADDSPDALFYRGVFAANAGNLEGAWALLDKALEARPSDPSVFYARAAVRSLQGNVDGSASELRKAVAIEPRYRFQAAADPDFDKVRDEAAFIDVIEPTNTART